MMAHLKKKDRLLAMLLGASLAAGSAMAQAPAPQPAAPQAGAPQPATQDDTVSEVTVKGSKLPDALATKAATCEALVKKDPAFRRQLALAKLSGNSMMGPRIFLPTRAPRNPDYRAAPLSQPGSAIPEVSARWHGKGRVDDTANNASVDVSTPTVTPEADGAEASPLSGVFGQLGNASQTTTDEMVNTDGTRSEGTGDLTLEETIDACRGFYNNQGGGVAGRGRADIAGRDKTLPTGLVLFDDGRYEEALDYFQQAYRKLPTNDGGDEAALMIGKIHLFALRDRSDPKEGVMWLKRAAGAAFNPATSMPVFDPKLPQNNTAIGEAALLLGQLYLSGAAGVSKDPAEARKWFERAAYVGHVPAGKVLGDMHYQGVGGTRDLKKAFEHYEAAAKLGHAPAQYALAEMYYTGEHGGPADKTKALAWYNEAAKLDHSDALYTLANAYDTGDGVAADPQKAVALYKLAAVKGNVAAMTAMGTYFYQGEQVQKDEATARKWFETAALKGDPDAMFNLAAMMTNGQGGSVDRAKAWVWFKLAQAKGIDKAGAAIAALEKKMTAEERASAASLLAPKAS